MIALLLLLTINAFAASDSMDAYDKTYPRDNTFCSSKGKRVELMIRGSNKFIEPRERGYGEFLFYKRAGIKPKLLDLNSLRGDTYRLFNGTSPLCSKTHGYKISQDTVAILLLKENKPFQDKLVIQFMDLSTMTPKDVLETNYPTDKAIKTADGFSFRILTENYNPEMGKVKLESAEYIFQEKQFPQWMDYSAKGFVLNPETTFKRFPYKKLFKDKDDFMMFTSWNDGEKKFLRPVMYLAVNHKLRKNCLLFTEKKQKLVGNELWRCHAI